MAEGLLCEHTQPMILDCLERVLHRNHLTVDEASAVMEEILSRQASLTQTAAFLIALAMKGEMEEELLTRDTDVGQETLECSNPSSQLCKGPRVGGVGLVCHFFTQLLQCALTALELT